MLSLDSLIDQLSSHRRWPISSQAVMLIRHYRDLVGPGLSKHTAIKWIKNGTACIHCRNSMWSYALHSMEQEIIDKMNTYAGKTIITKILVRIGNVQAQKAKEPEVVISQEDLIWIENLSKKAPEDIREKFASFLKSYKGKLS
jgi:predicted nucleic acid-binding Zn ribbon protein